jgi:phenylpropionate dioxygenase-like ring-hydroxylating dioxygenase large terminal subunit
MTTSRTVPRNAWYAAAWGHEIKHDLAARKIFGEDVVLFRRTDGVVARVAGGRRQHNSRYA